MREMNIYGFEIAECEIKQALMTKNSEDFSTDLLRVECDEHCLGIASNDKDAYLFVFKNEDAKNEWGERFKIYCAVNIIEEPIGKLVEKPLDVWAGGCA